MLDVKNRRVVSEDLIKKRRAELEAKINRTVERIKYLENLKLLVNSEGWGTFEKRLLAEEARISSDLDNFREKNDREILILLTERTENRKLTGIRDFIALQPRLEEELIKLRQELEHGE